MAKNSKLLIQDFKRLIHVLSTSKNSPIEFGEVTLYRAEIHVLELIGDTDKPTVTVIAEKLGVTKGAISQIISKLLIKELIIKRDILNSNAQILSLTAKGLRVLSTHHGHELSLISQVEGKLEVFNESEIGIFDDIVNAVVEFIQRSNR